MYFNLTYVMTKKQYILFIMYIDNNKIIHVQYFFLYINSIVATIKGASQRIQYNWRLIIKFLDFNIITSIKWNWLNDIYAFAASACKSTIHFLKLCFSCSLVRDLRTFSIIQLTMCLCCTVRVKLANSN